MRFGLGQNVTREARKRNGETAVACQVCNPPRSSIKSEWSGGSPLLPSSGCSMEMENVHIGLALEGEGRSRLLISLPSPASAGRERLGAGQASKRGGPAQSSSSLRARGLSRTTKKFENRENRYDANQEICWSIKALSECKSIAQIKYSCKEELLVLVGRDPLRQEGPGIENQAQRGWSPVDL